MHVGSLRPRMFGQNDVAVLQLAAARAAPAIERAMLAGRQHELADDVAALADVLERLRSEAALEHRELAQKIERAARRNERRR